MDFSGVGRMRLPTLDSDMPVLLRLRRMARAQLSARFARLTRHQGPRVLRDQGTSRELVEKVADHCGVDLARFVDGVRYGSPLDGELARFSVEGGQRIITITNRLPQENKYMQLKTRLMNLTIRESMISLYNAWVPYAATKNTGARIGILGCLCTHVNKLLLKGRCRS